MTRSWALDLALLPLVLLAALGLSSCGAPQPVTVASAPTPVYTYGIEQQVLGSKTRFAVCADCEQPTTKTLRSSVQRSVVVNTQPRPAPPVNAPAPAAQAPSAKPVPPASRTEVFTVVFHRNSAALTPTARARLGALVPLANTARGMRVLGFTDDLGTQALNNRLGDRRALAVMLYLRERLSEPRPELAATAKPQCCYITDNRDEDSRAPNRRAEIALDLLDTPAVRALIAAARGHMLGATTTLPAGLFIAPDVANAASPAAALAATPAPGAAE